ncbi:hypothetical protein [Bacillus massiliglaciei]|uniref:hypothetical protein n=1 Tax=Bacillus massiliglaciei TaxID=1816693 RepID=UPI000DA60966|nr:hypothetical protein [Bacillus massiliglaciei]
MPQAKPLTGEKRPQNWLGTIKRIWGYLSVRKGLLFLVLLMVIVSSALGLLGPFLVGMPLTNIL